MKKALIVIIVALIVVLVIGAFWYESNSNQETVSTFTAGGTPASGETLTVGTNDAIGDYLEAANGMTLYTYSNDQVGTSTCSGECATEWPPYTVASSSGLTLDPTATGSIGTITRSDGTLQVTYNGLPLYYYSQDTDPGDVNGNGVDGLWTVATP